MNQPTARSEAGHRDRWLALLEENGVGPPNALLITEVPGGLVQATIGEPPIGSCRGQVKESLQKRGTNELSVLGCWLRPTRDDERFVNL